MKDDLTQRALDILNILWTNGEEMSSTDISDSMKGLTQSTVIAVLRNLVSLGYVEAVGVKHSGKVLTRTYIATDAAKEAVKHYFASYFQNVSGIVSLSEVIMCIIETAPPEKQKEELAKLKKLLEEKAGE